MSDQTERCPIHGSFVVEIDGSRHCNFTSCKWREPAPIWPKLRSQWHRFHTEGRMLLAETVLGWAVSLCPRDHPDTPDLLRCVMAYANKKVDDAMAKMSDQTDTSASDRHAARSQHREHPTWLELFAAAVDLLRALAVPIAAVACILFIIFAGASYDQEVARCLKAGGHWIKMDGSHQCVNWLR